MSPKRAHDAPSRKPGPAPEARKGAEPGESGFFAKRGESAAPERARLQIAHVLASGSIEDVELTLDCPGCGRSILVDAAQLATALGWRRASEREPGAALPESDKDVRERHISAVMRTDAPAVTAQTAIGMLPDMFEHGGAPCVVVVDDDGRPLGVVTPLDLFREVGTHGPGSIAGLGLLDVAKTQALYLRVDTRVSSALRLFAEQMPECIVAVSDAGKYAGVITPADLLHFLTR